MAKNKTEKEFGLSSWAIDNKTTIYVIVAIFLFVGLSAYYSMPRESFPEIKETKVYISSVYPGNTAEDIERLITDPLEEEIKNVSNVVEVLSTSQEDYSIITVEFDENITVEQALQKVKDEVDAVKAGEDWPTYNDAKIEPNVFDLNIAEETPISNINISGDYPVEKLKEYGEYLEKEIEGFPQIKQVDIRGAQEKEVEIAVDIYKMTAAKISFDDVINTIKGGNVTVSAGNLIASGQRRNIRVIGEIEKPNQLEDFVVKSENGATYLRDIAQITFKEEEKTTFARSYGDNVVMLEVKKRSGKNMIRAAEQIDELIAKVKKNNVFPPDVKIEVANDQSDMTINQVNDLVNNIIFGILLVVGVLTFFLGFRNALFVGFAIPMSMFMSFMILNLFGYTLNTMVLFGLVMGLGMLVDNGIVVVENVYRLMDEEGMSRTEAAKKGIGEIAFPIIISTATTVAAFLPLGFWPGVMGQFMMILPITLSIVLGSSLFVAVFFNSTLTSNFMKIDEGEKDEINIKQLTLYSGILFVVGLLIFIGGGAIKALGTLMIFMSVMLWVYKFALSKIADYFQNVILRKLEIFYRKFLKFALTGIMPYIFLFGTIALLFISFVLVGIAQPKVEFFPDNKPNQIIVYIEYPEGTDIAKTNKITEEIEQDVYTVLENYVDGDGYNYMVDSTVSQVGEGAGNPQTDGGSSAEMPHKGKITVSLREFKYRRGKDSEELRKEVQTAVKGYPGVLVSVEKDANGPPVGYPVNIEILGENYNDLIATADQMRVFLNQKGISGVEELKIDVNKDKPGLQVNIDREKAGELGISASQVGMQLRRALFGEKAGVYKENGEDYDINVRFNDENRYNKSSLFNQKITFRDPANGQIKEIPVAALVSQKNNNSFSAIKHRDLERVVLLYSGVLAGYNANEVVSHVKAELKGFDMPENVKYKFTGEMEEQEDNMNFLMGALMTGLGLIMLLLIFQFNSISKPLIIMMAIFLSFIGVLFGLVIFNMNFVIMMTMVGIISLAGIVVNNGVVLLDYTELLMNRKKESLGLPANYQLRNEIMFNLIVEGGKSRLRPVLLTAITTVLGLVPLAIGLNIDFFSLFSEFDPKIYVGGDNVVFWGPLAWTVIFGLTFATFLTLVIVPVSFYLVNKLKFRIKKNRQ
ncbi:efflux RND transporter permease subunit [Lutibacter sp. TH_r2]|uniref:efflux RND transporter permease subunit n=1 Tax=Lutibacter sp. TH_r2 TaxID=3082083 RepID=UPI002954B47F|nr:efflux RND transporter permease subunit [Lutibacter sp. TH_r2]MDV7186192.1 efflux RND transporter permease subunit [Lutibacter sp. TH_r2]